VYEGDWEAKTEKQLTNRIKSCLKKFDLKFVTYLMSGVRSQLKNLGQDGVFDRK